MNSKAKAAAAETWVAATAQAAAKKMTAAEE